jgi:RNA polymerase sigma-54 factor
MDQKMILAPRMIQSMEILQLPIVDLQAKIEKELQENPFLEQKEHLGEQTETAETEFNPDAPLKHDDSGDLEFSRLEALNRDWDNHFNEEHRISRGALEEEGDRKLDAMANMPDRPQSLQDHLAEQLGEMELDEAEKRLAKHICSFIDRTGYLGSRAKVGEGNEEGRETFRRVAVAEIAQA